jgi:hypothetical protein
MGRFCWVDKFICCGDWLNIPHELFFDADDGVRRYTFNTL